LELKFSKEEAEQLIADGLLIEPFGIEIEVADGVTFARYPLLIEPFGIEIL